MRNKLISILAGAVFSFGVSGLAFAAAPKKKIIPPPPPPAPVYSWTGWYVGGNAGWGWGNREMSNSVVDPFCINFSGCTVFFQGNLFAFAASPSFDVKANGFIGGGQIGYNWQNGNSVAGIEADFQGADIQGTASFANSVNININSFINVAGIGRSSTGSAPCEGEWVGYGYLRRSHM